MSTRLQRILGGGSAAEDDQLESARGVMMAFERVWSGTRLMGPDHPAREQQLENFVSGVKEHLASYEQLTLDVAPFAFTQDGMEVLKVERARENYIYRLYQDGVRRLMFTDDLTGAELSRFLALLRTNFADPNYLEDDLVTLMWDAELEGVEYRAIESVTEGDSAGDRTDLPTVEQLLEIAGQLAPASPPAPASGPPLDDATLAQQALHLSQRVQPSMARESEQLGLSEAETTALQTRFSTPTPSLGARVGEIVYRTSHTLGEGARPGALTTFSEFNEERLAERNTQDVSQGLGAAQALAKAGNGAELGAAIFKTLEQPAIVRALVQLVVAGDAQAMTLLQATAAYSLPAVWTEVFARLDPGQRRPLWPLLEKHAPRHMEFLAQQVAESTQEVAVAALGLLRKLDPTPVCRELLGGLRHESPEVRIDTAMTLRKVDDPIVRQTLLMLTKDADERVRVQVYNIIAQAGGSDVEQALVAIVREAGFHSRSEDEQKRAVICLGRAATDAGLGVLRRIALSEAEGRVPRDVQIAAIRVLGQRRDNNALGGLRQIAGKLLGAKELKEAAKAAIAAIEGGGA